MCPLETKMSRAHGQIVRSQTGISWFLWKFSGIGSRTGGIVGATRENHSWSEKFIASITKWQWISASKFYFVQLRAIECDIYDNNRCILFLQKKIMNFESDYNSMETKYEQLIQEHEILREHTRKVEQKNDDLERSNRVVSATVNDLEAMLNQAYEKNEFLELEVEDKESLSEKHQRVLDELRGKTANWHFHSATIQWTFLPFFIVQIWNKKWKSNRTTSHPLHVCISCITHTESIHIYSTNDHVSLFLFLTRTDSDNVLNGNTPPIASQKAFTIIADSLRRIDVSRAAAVRRTPSVPKYVKLSTVLSSWNCHFCQHLTASQQMLSVSFDLWLCSPPS